MEELRKYDGRRWSVVIMVREIAQAMAEREVRETDVYIPTSDGDVTIKMKR